MKTITINCPHCKKSLQYGLTDSEKKQIFSLLTKDDEFMRELGIKAAKRYVIELELDKLSK